MADPLPFYLVLFEQWLYIRPDGNFRRRRDGSKERRQQTRKEQPCSQLNLIKDKSEHQGANKRARWYSKRIGGNYETSYAVEKSAARAGKHQSGFICKPCRLKCIASTGMGSLATKITR
jgi:hypothetical protein